MKIPKALERVVESFERLPGIGPKSAQRLGFYLLHVPQSDLEDFADALINLKKNTKMCAICFNIGTTELCDVCADPERDNGTICVVEDALDVLAFEKSDKYKGVYHVLHGVVDPLNSIGPDDIYIPQLMKRLRETENRGQIKEIIVATNPTMEGEATAMYIVKQLKIENGDLRITRIGRGLPVGADIEYADEVTLGRALEGRSEY
jgi:recombination protein RecR